MNRMTRESLEGVPRTALVGLVLTLNNHERELQTQRTLLRDALAMAEGIVSSMIDRGANDLEEHVAYMRTALKRTEEAPQ